MLHTLVYYYLAGISTSLAANPRQSSKKIQRNEVVNTVSPLLRIRLKICYKREGFEMKWKFFWPKNSLEAGTLLIRVRCTVTHRLIRPVFSGHFIKEHYTKYPWIIKPTA